MTVREAIEQLQKFPQDVPLFLWNQRLAPEGDRGYFAFEISEEPLYKYDDEEDENGNFPEYPAVCISFESIGE